MYLYLYKKQKKLLQAGWPNAIGTWRPTDV
jgi:hypothetical protein